MIIRTTTRDQLCLCSKNPGSWADKLKVCYIDDAADQRIGINTTNLATAGSPSVMVLLLHSTNRNCWSWNDWNIYWYLKGIITGVNTDASGN